MNEERVTRALEFISVHRMAVLATSAPDRQPECALVAYAAKGGRLIVGTDSSTRKYANLERDPRVAVVIGLDAPRTLQYEGDATELSGEAAREHAALLLERHPETAAFVSVPTARTFLITPRWMRFTDYSSMPPDIFELHF
jgi:nitroimidazol reductase NimA-like FMN-containing flavoprotein (pyridoxamine 5'-phosphate oxidase superfamily)